jgi:hypothetical protein
MVRRAQNGVLEGGGTERAVLPHDGIAFHST